MIRSTHLETDDYHPEIRVFICGTEIKDVVSATITNSIRQNPGNCSISLTNQDDKWIVTRRNLQKQWELYKSQTKMIFEMKYASGIYVNEGDPVFQIMDPIRIFIKGRFTSGWYFGFTGYIDDITETYNPTSSTTLDIKCSDILKLFNYSKANLNPAMVKAFNLELRTDFFTSRGALRKFTGGSFVDIMKEAVLGENYQPNTPFDVKQSKTRTGHFRLVYIHPSRVDYTVAHTQMMSSKRFFETDLGTTDKSISVLLSQVIKALENFIIAYPGDNRIGMSIDFIIDLKNLLESALHSGDEIDTILESYTIPFIAAQYMSAFSSDAGNKVHDDLQQLGSVDSGDIPTRDAFNSVLKKLIVDIPVLYQAYFGIPENTSKLIPLDTVAIAGVKGTKDSLTPEGFHPALLPSDIDKFELLTPLASSINQLLTGSTSDKRFIRTPYEKIRENIEGDPNSANYEVDNYFPCNPRFFLITPDGLSGDNSIFAGQFREFVLTQAGDFESLLSIIYNLNKVIDFQFYATPMGDIICEPFHYDNMPWNFDAYKNKDEKIVFKEEAYGTRYTPPAYKFGQPIFPFEFNDDAPFRGDAAPVFFVRNRDLLNISNEQYDSKIRTSVHVIGRLADDFIQIPYLEGYAKVIAQEGFYVADGFQNLWDTAKEKWDDPTFISDLKTESGRLKLNIDGSYQRDQDLISIYGMRPTLDIDSRLVKQSTESQNYAKIWFLRSLAQVYPLNLTMLFTPELFLNRPMYVARKNRLGLLTQIAHSYQQNSSFTTQIQLEYVRKNIFSYEYDLSNYDQFKKTGVSFFPTIGLINYDDLHLDFENMNKDKKEEDLASVKTPFQIKILEKMYDVNDENGNSVVNWVSDGEHSLADISDDLTNNALLTSKSLFISRTLNYNISSLSNIYKSTGDLDGEASVVFSRLARNIIPKSSIIKLIVEKED